MVQVDVFWSYGLGASLAVSATRQLHAQRRAATAQGEPAARGGPRPDRWSDPYLLRTLLFLALVFAPSGAYLLWEFPSWETMHAGDRDLPAWLVALFAATNVGLGLAGYLVVDALLARGRSYAAYLQIVGAYFAMFFVLIHGWDGQGYQRFFSPTRGDFLVWNGDWQAWLTSPVALTLYAMGAVLVPLLLWMWTRALIEGRRLDGGAAAGPGAVRLGAVLLATVFGAGLGLAVVAHLLIAIGGLLGAVAAAAVGALALVPRGPVHVLFRQVELPESRGEAPALAPLRADSTTA